MAAHKRETGKNYIGLLSDEAEEPHAADAPSGTTRHTRGYLLGLLAMMFCRRSEAR